MGAAGRGLPELLAWTIPARGLRIVGVGLIAWAGGRVWRRVAGERRNGGLLLLYGGVWLAVYATYVVSVGF